MKIFTVTISLSVLVLALAIPANAVVLCAKQRKDGTFTGHRSIHAAYGALYDLDTRLAEPAFDLAAETAMALETRRSTVVLLTSVVDLAAAELLRTAVLRLEPNPGGAGERARLS